MLRLQAMSGISNDQIGLAQGLSGSIQAVEERSELARGDTPGAPHLDATEATLPHQLVDGRTGEVQQLGCLHGAEEVSGSGGVHDDPLLCLLPFSRLLRALSGHTGTLLALLGSRRSGCNGAGGVADSRPSAAYLLAISLPLIVKSGKQIRYTVYTAASPGPALICLCVMRGRTRSVWGHPLGGRPQIY